MRVLLSLGGATLLMTGCGVASPGCTTGTSFVVSPVSATATHGATSPANQVQFTAVFAPTASPGCPVPQFLILALPVWANPDPLDISITGGTAFGSSNGLATCNAATSGAVTLTATTGTGASQYTKTVQLTCN